MEWKCERGRKKGKVERFLDKKTGAASMLNQKSLSLSLSVIIRRQRFSYQFL
jgi:hypothetical protein